MTTSQENPYQSPQALTAEIERQSPAVVDWKSILKRWEILRIPYNFLVGLTGLLVLTMVPLSILPEAVCGAVVYGLAANVLYLLGPAAELYLNWITDALEHRLVPRWVARFVRSTYLTAFLFIAGSLFSLALTLVIGLLIAFPAPQ